MLLSMDAVRQKGSVGDLDGASLETQVQRILLSRTFRRAKRLRGLLEYVAANALAGAPLAEAKTARELYGNSEFNPTIDPSIRVQFGRLRRLLSRYYEIEGHRDPIVLQIPHGRYTPVFQSNSAAVDGEAVMAGRRDPRERAPAPPAAVNGGCQHQRCIAVLPFTNLTNDPKQDKFCHGVMEEIVTTLANAPDIEVVASASGLQFKDEPTDVRAVGRELGVPFVLAGCVRKEGGHTRVTVQLARAEDGVAIWSETIDSHSKSILQTQKLVAQGVIGKLPLPS